MKTIVNAYYCTHYQMKIIFSQLSDHLKASLSWQIFMNFVREIFIRVIIGHLSKSSDLI